MSDFTYEVIKETTDYDITSITVVERFDSPAQALRMRDSLQVNADYGVNFYVEVVWGSIDNV